MEQTRLQVPMSIRKTGLWITYVLYDKTVVTEMSACIIPVIFTGFIKEFYDVYKKETKFDLVDFAYTSGGVLNTVTKYKWELISSHTARRSATTNMYLAGRMKTFKIMQLT